MCRTLQALERRGTVADLAVVEQIARGAGIAIISHGHNQWDVLADQRSRGRVHDPSLRMHQVRAYPIDQPTQTPDYGRIGKRRVKALLLVLREPRHSGGHALDPVHSNAGVLLLGLETL